MEVKVFRRIDDVNGEMWDSILTNNESIKSYNFLKAVEYSNLSNCDYWYIMFIKNGALVAHATLFSIFSFLDEAGSPEIRNIVAKIRRLFPSFLKMKILGCGTPIATCSNVITISTHDFYREVFDLLLKLIKKIAREEKAHVILFRDFSKQETLVLNTLTDKGFLKIPTLPTTFVDISWKTFDEYVQRFKQKPRGNIKRNLTKLNAEGISVEVCHDFGRYSQEIYSLYLNVYNKANSRFEKLTPKFFESINKNLKDQSKVILVKAKEEIIGFELMIEDEDILRPLYLGINYNFNERYKLYFNLIYEIIKFGIENGKRIIELGQTTYYPKLMVGARVEPLYMYIRFTNIIIQQVLRIPLPLLFPERDFTSKYIFRNTSSQ